MMLNKGVLWVFGTSTLKTMEQEIDNYLKDIAKDPEPDKNTVNVLRLRDLIRSVIKERLLEESAE